MFTEKRTSEYRFFYSIAALGAKNEKENTMKNTDGMYFEAEGTPGQPPAAELSNTEETKIPKSRFDEVNNKMKDYEAKLRQMEEERKAETEKRLEEQQKWQELAESRGQKLTEAERKAALADEYEVSLKKLLDAQLAEMTDDSKKLIPAKLPVQDQLDYIASNRAFLFKPTAPNIDAGSKGSGSPESGIEDLSQEELIVARKFNATPEEYKKFKT